MNWKTMIRAVSIFVAVVLMFVTWGLTTPLVDGDQYLAGTIIRYILLIALGFNVIFQIKKIFSEEQE